MAPLVLSVLRTWDELIVAIGNPNEEELYVDFAIREAFHDLHDLSLDQFLRDVLKLVNDHSIQVFGSSCDTIDDEIEIERALRDRLECRLLAELAADAGNLVYADRTSHLGKVLSLALSELLS